MVSKSIKRPPLNTQARIVFDHAEVWHLEQAHKKKDVRKCTACRSDSPYKVMLNRFFPIGEQ
jgi:hypothetical protein